MGVFKSLKKFPLMRLDQGSVLENKRDKNGLKYPIEEFKMLKNTEMLTPLNSH